MIAICHIRQMPHYRRGAFEQGLRAVGYRLVTSGAPAGPEDLFIIWNRYAHFHSMATAWERQGGTVLVAENGYAGVDAEGRQYYALSATGHNGSGWFPVGNEKRFPALGLEVKPWRELLANGYWLVCGQRGIGSPEMASPDRWHATAAAAVTRLGKTPKIRLHPGTKPPPTTLADDLAGANACVIWSSSSGVKALLSGVRVVYDAPHWICAPAAQRLATVAEKGLTADDGLRDYALERMAHAQWAVAEIESGEPFARFRDAIGARSGKAAA